MRELTVLRGLVKWKEGVVLEVCKTRIKMTYCIAFLVVLLNVAYAANTGLGPYKVSDVTVSGFSAGGFMAVQMHVAYSSVVNGSAVFAGVRTFTVYFITMSK